MKGMPCIFYMYFTYSTLLLNLTVMDRLKAVIC